MERNRPSDDFEVYGKRAWRTLLLFLAMSTQWRVQVVSGMKGSWVLYLGLDYAALEPTARMAKLRIDPDVLDEIQAMEVAALEILNER